MSGIYVAIIKYGNSGIKIIRMLIKLLHQGQDKGKIFFDWPVFSNSLNLVAVCFSSKVFFFISTPPFSEVSVHCTKHVCLEQAKALGAFQCVLAKQHAPCCVSFDSIV